MIELRVKLRSLRQSKGVSQTFIAKALGFSYPSGYANIEMGRNGLSLEQAAVIAGILKVPVEELLEDEKKFEQKLHKKSKNKIA